MGAPVVLIHIGDKERSLGVGARPRYILGYRGDRLHGRGYHGIIVVIDNAVAGGEERSLFLRLLCLRRETLAVLTPEAGEHANGGAYHSLERSHLAGERNARLNDGERRVFVDFPERKRHTNLAVEAARAAHYAVVVLEQLIEPFLHRRLATAARDADNRNAETAAMIGGNGVECRESVGNHKEIGIAKLLRHALERLDHKVANTALI